MKNFNMFFYQLLPKVKQKCSFELIICILPMIGEEQNKEVPVDHKPALEQTITSKKKETSQEFIERLRREDEARLVAFKKKMKRQSQISLMQFKKRLQAIKRQREEDDIGFQLKQFFGRAFNCFSNSKTSEKPLLSKQQKSPAITNKIFTMDDQEQQLLNKKQ